MAKLALALSLTFCIGCATGPEPGHYDTLILHAVAMTPETATPITPVVNTECDGSGYITHGDGHKTPCPGCAKCQARSVPTADCQCENCDCDPCECNPVKTFKAVAMKPIETGWEPCQFQVCEGGSCRTVNGQRCFKNAVQWGWDGKRMYKFTNQYQAIPYEQSGAATRQSTRGGCVSGSCGPVRRFFGRLR